MGWLGWAIAITSLPSCRRPRRPRSRLRWCHRPGGLGGSGLRSGVRALRGVHDLGQLVARLLHLLGRGLDGVHVGALERLLRLGDGLLSGGLHVGRSLVAHFLERLLGGVHQRVGVVANLDLFLALGVFLGMGLGVLHHALDLVVVQRGGAGDGDLLLLAGAQVLRRHVHDAVGVDVESDLDLRHTTARSRDAGELELAQRLVVGGHLALALQHVHLDRRLVVGRGGVDLGLAGGMVVLRSIIFVMTPPIVSTPSDSGVTSSSRMPSTSPASTPPGPPHPWPRPRPGSRTCSDPCR